MIKIPAYSLTPEIGCQTVLYCALNDNVGHESGHYYYNCTKFVNSTFAVTNYITKHSCDDQTAERLWHFSCELLAKININLININNYITNNN